MEAKGSRTANGDAAQAPTWDDYIDGLREESKRYRPGKAATRPSQFERPKPGKAKGGEQLDVFKQTAAGRAATRLSDDGRDGTDARHTDRVSRGRARPAGVDNTRCGGVKE